MKKYLIIILIVLIILLGGVWLYLLLNGAPASVSDITKNLFGNATNVANTPAPLPQPSAPAPLAEDAATDRTISIRTELVKLTERPVAGAVFVAPSASSTAGGVIRYMTKGTGNVFDIDAQTGLETRISNQTIPQVVEAIWSPNGKNAVLITDNNATRGEIYLATLSQKSGGDFVLDTEKLPAIENSIFNTTGETLFYTQPDERGGTTGYARVVQTGVLRQLFTIPFRESSVLWDIWKEKTHYVYTKPALGFNGYLYEILPTGLKKVDSAKTLSATRLDTDALIINKDSGSGPYSLLLNTKVGRGDFLSIETVAEKCAGSALRFWCGTADAARANTFPVAWYQGSVVYADSLWSTNEAGDSTKIADPEILTREQIDVTGMIAAPGILLFKNKTDDSLWLYNLPR